MWRIPWKQLFDGHENEGEQGTDDRGRCVRDSEGRLEGIVLLPPQLTLIRESSFSKVNVYCGRNGRGVSAFDREPGTEVKVYPELLVIDQHAIHILGGNFCASK